LAPSQAKQLFRAVRRFAEEDRSVIFISHKLEEMKEVADRITVLRDGHVVGTVDADRAEAPELAKMMVGRSVFMNRQPHSPAETHEEVLVIDHLNSLNDRGTQALRNLCLTVHAGEIVGVAGVDGNGQRELAECICGLRLPTSGTIRIKNQLVKGVIRDPSILGFVPEDRRKTGLVLEFSVAENLLLKTFAEVPFTQHGIMQWSYIRKHADELIEEFGIKAPNSMVSTKYLSGGNQQRVVVARELSEDPSLLVTSQPTRGLDIGSVEAVHKILLRERNQGVGVLFISTELPEVMSLSDRIIVMYKGEIMGELKAETADVNVIGELMLGHQEALNEGTGGAG
jgi:ABC-type uncharacterized transport system ATPase subunit